MNWESISPELRDLIERAGCTPKEIEVLKLRAAGVSLRGMARVLGISRESVRGRLENADRKIQAELAAQRGIE